MGATVFVVDDDAAQLRITEEILAQKCHYRTVPLLGGKAAIERFLLRLNPQPDAILLDLIMPDVTGVEVVRAIRRSNPNIPIILLAPKDQHALVLEAMQAGANDCLQKPVNVPFLRMTIEKHLQREAMREELCRLSRYERSQFEFDDLVAESESFKQTVMQVRNAASQSLPVCIDGETGVGKELVARVIHSNSAHAEGPFVALSCNAPHAFFDAIMPEAVDGALANLPFGFSGPTGGTFFLRHIENLSMDQQIALAQFLLNVRAADNPDWLHVRFVVSCLEPISALYRQGRLHEKLYFYFSACSISIAPLRERPEDIPAIASYYLKRFTSTQPYTIREVSVSATNMLTTQEWPENVNELMSLMQRASFHARGPVLELKDLMALQGKANDRMDALNAAVTPNGHMNGKGQYSLLNHGGEVKPFEQLEAEIIRFAIEHYGGKMTEVAKKLGIGRSTLYRKMQDYKLKHVA